LGNLAKFSEFILGRIISHLSILKQLFVYIFASEKIANRLLANLHQPNLPIEMMFKKVRNIVLQKTGNRQTPWESSSLKGENFYFVKKKTVVTSANDTPPVVPVVPIPSSNTGVDAEDAEMERLKREKPEAQARQAEAERERLAQIQARRQKTSKVFRDTLSSGGKGPEMVRIPAGSFRMGDIQGSGSYDEKPVHRVSIGAFAMEKYEVTFAEYDKFVQATGREKPDDEGLGRGNLPVINVSWHDANAYAKWLSKQTGKKYRLPTEAEWEYAARAGTTTKYWWGNTASHEYMNYGTDRCCDGLAKGKDRWKYTAPVGSFSANPFGIYDTAGNVWEWVSDIYSSDYYSSSPRSNPKGPSTGRNRVVRGGAWNGTARNARAGVRGDDSPGDRNYDLGFRLARQP